MDIWSWVLGLAAGVGLVLGVVISIITNPTPQPKTIPAAGPNA